MGIKVYIDLGANVGDTIAKFTEANPTYKVWGFEANPTLLPALKKRFAGKAVQIIGAAAWVSDGEMPMYLGHPLSGTLVEGKRAMPEAPHFEVDYKNGVQVKTIDFANWLKKWFSLEHEIIVKMDIEGAEYEVLKKMLRTNAIDLVKELRCEFHQDRFPISRQRHLRLKKNLQTRTKLMNWS